MKVKQITEVGVAVKDLKKATRRFVDLLGADAGEVITVKRYAMRYRIKEEFNELRNHSL